MAIGMAPMLLSFAQLGMRQAQINQRDADGNPIPFEIPITAADFPPAEAVAAPSPLLREPDRLGGQVAGTLEVAARDRVQAHVREARDFVRPCARGSAPGSCDSICVASARYCALTAWSGWW